MIYKILVPTDFSEEAEHAEKLAVNLAKRFEMNLTFYHNISLPFNWEKLPIEEQVKHPQKIYEFDKMKKNFERIKEKYAHLNVPIQTLYSSGNLPASVAQLNERNDYDLMIMGSKGAFGVQEFLYGTNAQKLIRRSNIPTLVVKDDIKANFKHIVFASDFQMEAMPAFEKVIEFGRMFGSTIHLLYIMPNNQFYAGASEIARMKAFEKVCWHLPVVLHTNSALSVEKGIEGFQADYRFDLLAITHTGGNLLKQIRQGSISEALVNHTETPVFVLHSIQDSVPSDEEELFLMEI